MVPLGSVGLAAMEIALTLRKDESIPVFFADLILVSNLAKLIVEKHQVIENY